MTEVIVRTPQGDQICETVPPKAIVKDEYEFSPRRVGMVDLDGQLGLFLSQVLPEIAPHSFNPGNWKGKLSTFITSKTTSFICCGRAVGLAFIEQDPMTGINRARTLFCIVADGGTEKDGYEVMKAIKTWAWDQGLSVKMPEDEHTNLAPGKFHNFFKAEKVEEWVIPPPKK